MSAGIPPSPSPEAGWEPHYVALLWGRGTQPRLADKLRAAVADNAPHLQTLFESDGLLIRAGPANAQLKVYANDSGRLVALGTLFTRDGLVAPPLLDGDVAEPELAARDLFGRLWGGYVAFAVGADGATCGIIRDPSGALPVFVIDAGGAAVICDSYPAWLSDAVGRAVPIDKDGLANALALPLLTTHRSLLRNIFLVPAGSVLSWRGGFGNCRLAWSPSSFVDRPEIRADQMRESVLACVRAYGGLFDRVLVELSGGLDSAIVLGALASSGRPPAMINVNLATTYRGGDERLTARDAAEKWRSELVEIVAREEELDYRAHLAGPQPLQPLLYGLDPILEASVSGVANAFNAVAIMTGQGGDACFYQMPTDRIARDYMRRFGPRALFSAVAMDAARRTRLSIWRVQWRMAKDMVRAARPEHMPVERALLGPAALACLDDALIDHPWLADAHQAPPGKQLQILALANCQLFYGPSLRRQTAFLVHPLMAQPVVETCLGIPSYELSFGTRDRALARSVFSDLLPPSIERRRGKGETSSYYRRAIVENLPFLRPHLLDGCLVANDLLAPDRLDALLSEDALMWSEEARMISLFASFEAWARYWGL